MPYISSRVKETFRELFYYLFRLVLTMFEASILDLTLLILVYLNGLIRLIFRLLYKKLNDLAFLIY